MGGQMTITVVNLCQKELDTRGLEGLRVRNGYRLHGLQVDKAGSGLYLMADFITTLIELSGCTTRALVSWSFLTIDFPWTRFCPSVRYHKVQSICFIYPRIVRSPVTYQLGITTFMLGHGPCSI